MQSAIIEQLSLHDPAPEVASAGRRLVFHPLQSHAEPHVTQVDQETRFRLPWRTQHSEVSRALDMRDLWDEAAINRLRGELAQRFYSFVLFLCHVPLIEVFSGTPSAEKPVAGVRRALVSAERVGQLCCEIWDVTYQQAAGCLACMAGTRDASTL